LRRGERLLIAGVHTRPAVASARRSGYTVETAEHFGDCDTRAMAERHLSIVRQMPYRSCGRVEELYSDERLLKLMRRLDGDRVILTTPLPFRSRKLAGTDGFRMMKVSDKRYQLERLRNRVRMPESAVVGSREEALGAAEELGYPVVLKPCHGAGGSGVVLASRGAEIPELREEHILQRYIPGRVVSVSLLVSGGDAVPLSVTQNLHTLGTWRFRYAGSIAPHWCAEEALQTAVEAVCAFRLRGWCGVDLVEGRDGYYFLELNPRFQGSLDAVEGAYGVGVVEAHIAASEGELPEGMPTAERVCARLTLFAPRRVLVRRCLLGVCSDVPVRNAVVEAGEPLATLIVRGRSRGEVMKGLKALRREVLGSTFPVPQNF